MERRATVTPPTCFDQFQTYPEGDGYEPRGGSDLTGTGIRAEGVVVNVCLCSEMRTISEYDWWRKAECVRVIRLLELLFFPEKGAVRRSRSRLVSWELQART